MKESFFSKIAQALIIFLVFYSNFSLALVEYGDSDESSIKVSLKEKLDQKRSAAPVPSSKVQVKKIPRSGAVLTEKMFDIGLSYENLSVKQEETNATVGLVRFSGQVQLPINIFLDFSYYGGKTDNQNISKESSFQKGNPKFVLGFNWLKIGSFEDQMKIDIFGGFSAKEKNSALGASRNDKIFGLRTSKNFYTVVLGLIAELTLTGAPDDQKETSVGNITKLGGAFGWVASNDIRMELEYNNFFIRASDIENHENKLANDMSFGVVSPRILLNLVNGIDFSLGAHFQTKKNLDTRPLLKAKLYDIPGVYGNSVFLGLNFSM